MKFLSAFLYFDLLAFLADKRLSYIKAEPWRENETVIGSKVTVQIFDDRTVYPKEDISNFGEQFVVKVRGTEPLTYVKWKPFSTEVTITDIEKATVYGEYRNSLSVIATVTAKSA